MTAQADQRDEQPGSPARPRERLRPAQRLHDPEDFQRVYAAQRKINTPQVVICYAPNGLAQARLGVSVGSQHGNAVRRNRIKRVLRAAFRQSQHALPPGVDYVLIPRRGTDVKAFATAAISRLLRDAAGRIAVPVSASGGRPAGPVLRTPTERRR